VVAEHPAETSFNPQVWKKLPYEVRLVPANDPAVKLLRSRFFAHYNIPEDTPNPNLRWFGVFNKVTCLLVFALGQRADGGVEGTDFYVLPTRDGVKAAEWTLQVSVELINAGVAPYFYMWVLGRNTAMQQRLKKVFQVEGPRSVMFCYGK
jgi:hypothetical protein